MEKYRLIEKSIIKKYRKDIWSKFIKAIKEYELLKEGDKIAVCISGGKDSFLLAKCFEELKKHGQFHFDLCFIVMNPGYSEKNINKITELSQKLNISLDIFDTNVFEISSKLNNAHPCYMCARMRRGHLYNKAKELGCNKIALGHHFDDVIETILLNVLYGGGFKTMMPKVKSANFEGLELIRPLYLVKEKSIINWATYNELEFLNCACSFTEKQNDSKRAEIKTLIQNFRQTNKFIEYNIFKSAENVNQNAILGSINNDHKSSFLDNYDD